MALSANTNKYAGGDFRSRATSKDFIVKNGSTVYQGSLVGVEHGTGHVVPLDDATDRSFVGIAAAKVVGDGTLTVQVYIPDMIITGASVTGFSAQTACLQPVYATADGTLTLTRPADDAVMVALTQKYTSSGVGDILAFGAIDAAILKLSGGGKKRLVIGSPMLANIANANVFSFTLWGHGKIVEIGAQPWKPPTTSSKTTALTGAINGSAITTGVLTLTSAGLATAGTAQSVTPSAANEFWDGDILTLTAGSTTAFVEGGVMLYVDVEYLP